MMTPREGLVSWWQPCVHAFMQEDESSSTIREPKWRAVKGTCYRGPKGTCYRGPFDVLSRTFPQGKTLNGKEKVQPETLKRLYYVES